METENEGFKELDELYDENGDLRQGDTVEPEQDKLNSAHLTRTEEAPRAPQSFSETIEEAGGDAAQNPSEVETSKAVDPDQGSTAVPSPGEESYFDDDEEFLRGDSKVLLSEKDGGILENLENVVTWEVDNFYNEAGKQRGRYALRTDPPVFRIRSSDGDGAEFILTKDLAGEMERIMGDVYRGYFGITPKEKKKMDQEGMRGYMDKTMEEIKNHPLRTTLIAIFIIACIFYLVIN